MVSSQFLPMCMYTVIIVMLRALFKTTTCPMLSPITIKCLIKLGVQND